MDLNTVKMIAASRVVKTKPFKSVKFPTDNRQKFWPQGFINITGFQKPYALRTSSFK